MTAQTFDFTHEGKTYTIPAFSALPMGALRRARKAKDEIDQIFTILEMTVGEDSEAIAAIDKMAPAGFEEFVKAWTQGANAGESSSSES